MADPIKLGGKFKHVASLPEGETCVGITVFKGRVLVVTEKGLYRLVRRPAKKAHIKEG